MKPSQHPGTPSFPQPSAKPFSVATDSDHTTQRPPALQATGRVCRAVTHRPRHERRARRREAGHRRQPQAFNAPHIIEPSALQATDESGRIARCWRASRDASSAMAPDGRKIRCIAQRRLALFHFQARLASVCVPRATRQHRVAVRRGAAHHGWAAPRRNWVFEAPKRKNLIQNSLAQGH